MKNNSPYGLLRKLWRKKKKDRYNVDKNKHTVQTDAKLKSEGKSYLLLLHYQGEKRLHLLKSLKRNLKRL